MIWRLLTLGLLLAAPAMAAGEAGGTFTHAVPAQKIFALLFLMIGPLKILGPFVAMTRGTDAAFHRRLATRAILFSAAALLIAGLLGHRMLQNFNIPIPILALTGGLVLFLVALQTLLEQFKRPEGPRAELPRADLSLAINPLAFPTIVTPYGIAAIIIFVSLAEGDLWAQLGIAALVAVILLVNWLAMLAAHSILKHAGTALQIFTVVLGVTQVSLGLLIMLQALSATGLFALRL